MNLADSVTIGITTKNRSCELDETLNRLVAFKLNDLPIIIFDDASDEPVDTLAKTLSQFKKLTLIRNKQSKGLVVNRNRIIEMAKTAYLISLDDDSCFADEPPLENSIKYLERYPLVVALEFANIEINQLKAQNIKPEIHIVKTYTGCGHILRCSTFLELGGYREYFFQMAEESDFCQRAWRKGYEIHTFPSIVVHHRRTSTSRLPDKIAFYQVRNIVLYNLLNKPFLVGVMNAIAIYPLLVTKNLRYPKLILHTTLGWINGIISVAIYWKDRTPMSWTQYSTYKSLPVPVEPQNSLKS
ncbi:glycosyltransferase [Coleofasciculus sp. FACHB-SPT9]|uniref:glycosyltransferase family 2 protein n=1 Tax=Cyanophyceae TaxID=3028117 RepID=UPI001684A3E3|nr:glycosyltransferase [Coleofasciculus sp. FACHB-SPT9]MBD1889377.1 glycosyltransferase [Coleofasciculus sp. FACHB-SPT9]